jgi:site-specific recombinase XerD
MPCEYKAVTSVGDNGSVTGRVLFFFAIRAILHAVARSASVSGSASGARIGSLRHGFRNAAIRAKLPDQLHQHDLRHRRVIAWLAEGLDVVLAKEAMGHSDLRTTMGYAHLAKEHLRALVSEPALVQSAKKTG